MTVPAVAARVHQIQTWIALCWLPGILSWKRPRFHRPWMIDGVCYSEQRSNGRHTSSLLSLDYSIEMSRHWITYSSLLFLAV